MRNTWTKTRKRDAAYYVAREGDWAWYVLKLYSDPHKPYARAFCVVVTPMTGSHGDMGDVYCADIPGLCEEWDHAHKAVAL